MKNLRKKERDDLRREVELMSRSKYVTVSTEKVLALLDGADAAEKNPSLEEVLAMWESQGPTCRTSQAERDFIAAMRHARSQGVGFGWMRQMIGIEWKHLDPKGCCLPDGEG